MIWPAIGNSTGSRGTVRKVTRWPFGWGGQLHAIERLAMVDSEHEPVRGGQHDFQRLVLGADVACNLARLAGIGRRRPALKLTVSRAFDSNSAPSSLNMCGRPDPSPA